MACDMPEPFKFPSLDSCHKRFLWTHKGTGLAPHLVVGLVLQVGDAEKFPHALGFESLDAFFFSPRISRVSPYLRAVVEDEGDKRLGFVSEADGVAPPDPV